MVRRCLVLLGLSLALPVCGAIAAAPTATGAPAPFSLNTLKPAPEPPNWIPLYPPSRTSLLWYPPFLRKIPGDFYLASTGLVGHAGRELVYLSAGPKNGGEEMATWPDFRIALLRAEQTQVHEEATRSGVSFRGGKGTCVMDDYVTRVKANHYRELACFVQGRTSASVIVAAALVSQWSKYGPQLIRAVESWQVS
jgi:hypothetical protein